MNLNQIARSYRVPLIDYGRSGDGILIATGAGLMMATMDAIPRLRYCMDLSGGRDMSGLESFLQWASRVCPLFVFHGWFSISEPKGFVTAIRPFSKRTVWRSNSTFPEGVMLAEDFQSLIRLASEFPVEEKPTRDNLSSVLDLSAGPDS